MKQAKNQRWTADTLLDLGRGYQPAAVFAAAADLNVFDALDGKARTVHEVARKLRTGVRGVAILLDALAALRLVAKRGDRYSLSPGTAPWLTSKSPESILPMARHQANCMRNWAQLANVIQSGRPADRMPSVRGAAGDKASFIGAMHVVSEPMAGPVVRALRALRFTHLLDVGGASGTWTMAFLRMRPSARATLFDLADVIPMARRRLTKAGFSKRVKLVPGDFMKRELPAGADLAWVSAIIHQNSRDQNRTLFARIFNALTPGGTIAIRDILMEGNRTQPVAGALFAVNMLAATEGGGTFTFEEVREDLMWAGFKQASVAREDPGMNAIVIAKKPE